MSLSVVEGVEVTYIMTLVMPMIAVIILLHDFLALGRNN